MPKATVSFKSHTKEVETGIAKKINLGVQKSLAILEGAIKINTPVKHGHLRRSISNHMTDEFSGEVFTGVVEGGAEINYAKHVEYGTKFMAPRAMFRKGAAASEDRIKGILNEALKK